ncbi:MAG: hypothetical protein ACXIVQ_12790 [Acidimicrobiales bacterium]
MNEAAWLVAIGIVAVLNPPRVAATVPRAGGQVDRVPLAAAGAVGSAVVLVALAALGPGLLSWLEVSEPTFRVGAGLVVAIAALRTVVVAPPAPEPALSGWGAAIVPVAVPAVLRPELGLLVISVGTVEGTVVAAVALGVAVVGVVAVSSARADGVAGRVLRWAGRVLSLVALVVGIALTVEGILAV